MDALTVWHNPRCSKSRSTLALIGEAGVEIEERRYLDDPPTAAEINDVLERLGIEPWDLTRMGEPLAAELGLKDLERDGNRESWIELLARNPKLIERPIVIAPDGRAVIARPPERVLEVLD